MKTYYDISEHEIKFNGIIIPKNERVHDYQVFLQEIDKGEAELIKYVPSWREVKKTRHLLLRDSDWAVMSDVEPKPSKEAWLTYRQALRDIPQNFEDTSKIIWPQRPE